MTDYLDSVASDPGEGNLLTYVPLKLCGHWRRHTPPGFLGLDRVLDEFGRHDHPELWGRLPAWKLMPFGYDKRALAFRAYRDLRLVNGNAVMRSVGLKATFTRNDLKACSRLYRSVCTRLLEAFEMSALPAYALHRPSGELVPILSPGLWSTQGKWAFYTGLVVVPDRAGQRCTARVLVRQTDFAEWQQRHKTRETQQQGRETRERIGQAIRKFMDETGCRPTRKQVRTDVERILGSGSLASKSRFADVWKALPRAKGGNPGTQRKAAYEAYAEELRGRIEAVVEARHTEAKRVSP